MRMETVQKITVPGFDAEGEPYIEVLADGSLRVVFQAMPPEDVPDHEFDTWQAAFKSHLGQAAGVPLDWQNRWMFMVWSPRSDTIERLVQCISSYRRV